MGPNPSLERTAAGAARTLELMEEALSAIFGLLYWRVLLSTAAAIGLALVLSALISPFTAGYCVTLVVLSFVFGLYWQSRAESGLSVGWDVPEPKISWPVTALGLAFIGFFFGGALVAVLGSPLAGGVALLVGAVAVAGWYRFAKLQPLPLRSFAFAVLAILFGFAPILLLTIQRAP